MLNSDKIDIINRLGSLHCSNEERNYKKLHLSKENSQNLLSLKDLYKNKRCFVVGSAPSLKKINLALLNNEYTFTVNRGYMLKDMGLLHSNFHVISDRDTFKDKDVEEHLLEGFSDCLFCYAGMEKPSVNIKTYYFDYLNPKSVGYKNKPFTDNILSPLIMYDSVIHFAIQIAAYMGFVEIYLIGIDLDFASVKGHAYKETDGEKERQLTHSIVMAKFMLNGIKICGDYLRTKGIKLINASPCGIVDCIERIKYEELFYE